MAKIYNCMLVLTEDKCGDNRCYSGYPLSQVKIIKKNLEAGKSYWEASPLYEITRDVAALILNLSWDEVNND